MSIVDKVKRKLKEYESENGPIHDDEYESLFVKFYLNILSNDPSILNPPKFSSKGKIRK